MCAYTIYCINFIISNSSKEGHFVKGSIDFLFLIFDQYFFLSTSYQGIHKNSLAKLQHFSQFKHSYQNLMNKYTYLSTVWMFSRANRIYKVDFLRLYSVYLFANFKNETLQRSNKRSALKYSLNIIIHGIKNLIKKFIQANLFIKI